MQRRRITKHPLECILQNARNQHRRKIQKRKENLQNGKESASTTRIKQSHNIPNFPIAIRAESIWSI
ncbi:hypothetical protein MANES_07G111802v8 [Manihot esculenta]|uniref:Uncharacterized protein n=1 Tax=Manihot esculenta TaxID=3983 RepID=A0ACB7HGJ8_MANES|nr:hypothetical protein MANES_07G111802v8 [Manihot esculenta]